MRLPVAETLEGTKMTNATGIWDKAKSWKPRNLVQPKTQSIREFYHDPNAGIHAVADILPAPAIPPTAPEGAPVHGHEPQQQAAFVVVNRGANCDLTAPGKQFFSDMLRNSLLHV